MLFEEKDSKLLKEYLLKLLDPISNADLDVLSDYILALLRHDQSHEDVKKLCLSQLEEFLRENTFSFVENVFNALEKKTYLSESCQGEKSLVEEKEIAKKRSFHQTSLDIRHHRANNGKRYKNVKSAHMNYYGNWRSPFHQKEWFSNMFSLPPGFSANYNKQRCKDYEERGYCMKGDMCPYDHGVDHIVMDGQYSDAYDPTQSILTNHSMKPINSKFMHKNASRNKEKLNNSKNDDSYSIIQKPNYNKTITTLIVKNIPNNDLNEENIHQFFKKFGEISKITIEKQNHLAILKFKDWKSANKAWSSPAPIFNNRFVKLFWEVPELNNKNKSQENGGFSHISQKPIDDFSKDEFMEKIEKKQKEHEEREQKRKENASIREMLQKQEELIQKELKEKRNLIALMSKKDADISESPQEKDHNVDKSSPSTLSRKALEIQLAALKAEADNLGIDIDTRNLKSGEKKYSKKKFNFYQKFSKFSKPYYKKKSIYYGSMQLDNRTRKIAVYNLDSDKDEILRQHLLHNGEYEVIEKDPDDPDAQIIVFKDRRTAEKFLHTAFTIPDMGNIKLKWKYDTVKSSENVLDHSHILESKENRGSNGRGFYDDDDDTGEESWRR